MTLKLRIKKEPHELLYVTISCMVLMSAICDSMFASILPDVVSTFYSIMTLLRIFLCVEAFIIIFKRGIKKIDILFIIIYPFMFLLSYYFTRSWDVFDSMFVALFLSRELKWDRTVNAYWKPLLAAFIIIVFSYFAGLFPVFEVYRSGGALRAQYGFKHPNDLSRIIMFLLILYMIKKEDSIRVKDIVLLMAGCLFVFIFPNSRDVGCVLLAFSVLLLIRIGFSKITHRDIFLHPVFSRLMVILFCTIVVGMWCFLIVPNLYNIICSIGGTFYSRFYSARVGLLQYGISTFGHNIKFAAEYSLNLTQSSQHYFVLDSVYFYLPIARGLIPALYFFVMFIRNIFLARRRSNSTLLLVLLIMIIYSIVEPGMLYLVGSFLLVLPRIEPMPELEKNAKAGKKAMNFRGLTRAPSKGHFTEQAEILHEKRITTSFVSESCMTLGNRNHEA